MISHAIEWNNIEAIEALTETDKFITAEQIDELIQLAIDKEQHEIYVILLNYKAEKLGFPDVKDQFKL